MPVEDHAFAECLRFLLTKIIESKTEVSLLGDLFGQLNQKIPAYLRISDAEFSEAQERVRSKYSPSLEALKTTSSKSPAELLRDFSGTLQ